MAYLTKIGAAAIRKELKAKYPNYKFSVVNSNHSAAEISIMAVKGEDKDGILDYLGDRTNMQVSKFHTEKHKDVANLIAEIDEIGRNAPGRAGEREYYDNTNAMVDYFDVAHYVFVSVGKWDKPFQVL